MLTAGLMAVKGPRSGGGRLRPMPLRPNTRRRICAWMMGVFLLMQCLVVAHACQSLAWPQLDHGGAISAAAQPTHCHQAESAHGVALCQAHCSAEQPAPAQPSPTDAPAPTLGGFVFVIPAVPVVAADLFGPSASPAPPASPPGWPPLYLTHGVLRN